MKSIIIVTILFVALGICMVSGAIPGTFENFQIIFLVYSILVAALVLIKYLYNNRNKKLTAEFWQWLRDDYRNRKGH